MFRVKIKSPTSLGGLHSGSGNEGILPFKWPYMIYKCGLLKGALVHIISSLQFSTPFFSASIFVLVVVSVSSSLHIATQIPGFWTNKVTSWKKKYVLEISNVVRLCSRLDPSYQHLMKRFRRSKRHSSLWPETFRCSLHQNGRDIMGRGWRWPRYPSNDVVW